MEPLLSLRTFLSDVEKIGELREVRGAHWDLEIGAIAELTGAGLMPAGLTPEKVADFSFVR